MKKFILIVFVAVAGISADRCAVRYPYPDDGKRMPKSVNRQS